MNDDELKQKIADLVKMIRLRERQDVHPDAPVIRDGKSYISIEDYAVALIEHAQREALVDDKEVQLGWIEANRRTVTLNEIIDTFKGQIKNLESQLQLSTDQQGAKDS